MPTISGARTLIVEDVMLIALELELTLSSAGAKVASVLSSLPAAIELLSVCPTAFDLVLFDIHLQGEHSYPAIDLCMLLGIPVVLVTGYAPHVLPERYQQLICVEKPFEPAQILRAAESALRDECPWPTICGKQSSGPGAL